MDLKQAKELVRSRLSDKRYEHTINVKKMAVKLAKRYGVDEDKAATPPPRRCGTASAPPFWRVPNGALRTKLCSAPSPAIPQARRA